MLLLLLLAIIELMFHLHLLLLFHLERSLLQLLLGQVTFPAAGVAAVTAAVVSGLPAVAAPTLSVVAVTAGIANPTAAVPSASPAAVPHGGTVAAVVAVTGNLFSSFTSTSSVNPTNLGKLTSFSLVSAVLAAVNTAAVVSAVAAPTHQVQIQVYITCIYLFKLDLLT